MIRFKFRPSVEHLDSRDLPSTTPLDPIQTPPSEPPPITSVPSEPGSSPSDDADNLAAQQRLVDILLREATLQMTGGVPSQPADPNLDPLLADPAKNPLTEKDLVELERLMTIPRPTAAQVAARNGLIARLDSDGLKLAGKDEIDVLERILGTGKTVLKGNPLTKLIAGYNTLIDNGLAGLEKLSELRYGQYQRARDGGAPHDEAATFLGDGDNGPTYLRRYQLEQLRAKLK